MAELLNAFFYCDPPYTSGCGYDVTTTEGFDHERLRDTLKNIEGRFLLSYDDSPKVRELYKGFEMIFIFIHGTDTLHCNQKNWNTNSDLCVCFESIKIFHVTGILKKIFS